MIALKRYFSLFKKDQGGNVIILFAAALLPIVMIAGGAIDYANAKREQSNLQNIVDSATLAGARALANGEDVNEAVSKYLHSDWPDSMAPPEYSVEVNNKDVIFNFTKVPVVQTKMLGMFGWGEMPVSARAVARLTYPILDIALANDRSDSMKNATFTQASEVINFLRRAEYYNNDLPPSGKIWVSFNIYKRKNNTRGTSLTLTTNFFGGGGIGTPEYVEYVDVHDSHRWYHDGNTAAYAGVSAALARMTTNYRCNSWPETCGSPAYKRYLFVLTDGDEDQPSAPACNQARASGLTVIVIGFPGGNMNKLLACAGDKDHLVWANGQQLTQMLDNIMKENTWPRLIQ